jgi:hypothetical protein
MLMLRRVMLKLLAMPAHARPAYVMPGTMLLLDTCEEEDTREEEDTCDACHDAVTAVSDAEAACDD